MNISYDWLKEFVDIDVVSPDVEAVAHTLTMLGLAVDEVEEVDADRVFSLDVTTNRPDCLNHLGVARELAAYYGLKLRKPDTSAPEESEPAERLPASVEILDPDLCPRYGARIVTGVHVGESPEWLKSRLKAAGQRPVNNVVDVTNFVLMELGHPLHAFDYERLAGGRIVVRRVQPGETLTTLDGRQQELQAGMLAICDAERPTALAGVMGGADSEIGQATRTILLESAYFQPTSIRSTAQILGMRTEASYRFERGADPEMPIRALNRACRLLEEVSGGRCVGPVIDVYPLPPQREAIRLSEERIEQVCGIRMDPGFVEKVLTSLEFEVSDGGPPWQVLAPTFRTDVSLEDDLVEEVLRHYGYDRVQATYPSSTEAGRLLPTADHDQSISNVLLGSGFYEAVNLIFTVPSREKVFWERELEMVSIRNPLTYEDTHLRTSLVPGLVRSVRHNFNHGVPDVRLFEIGNSYRLEDGRYIEEPKLGLAASGSFYQSYRTRVEEQFDFFHLKGIVESVFAGLGLQTRFERCRDVSFLHPGVSASVMLEGKTIGSIGELHPRISEEFKLKQSVLVAEVSLEAAYSVPLPEPVYQPSGRFPSVEQDLSFVVDKQTEYATIEAVIKALNMPDLRHVHLIDFYQGPKLPQGKVGLTLRLTFENPDRTLTQSEANEQRDAVLVALEKAVSAQIRS